MIEESDIENPATTEPLEATAEAPMTLDEARRALDAFRSTVSKAAENNPFVDLAAADRLADKVSSALDDWERLPDDRRRVVLSALSSVPLPEDRTLDLDQVADEATARD